MTDVIPTAPTVVLQGKPDDESVTEMGNAVSHKMQQITLKHQTPNIRLNLVARGTDMMATPNATPKIRCEIEKLALNCGFFRGRWGDSGRFATGDDRGPLVCRSRFPGVDIFGRRAARGEDV
jgi:hypothetical protein